MKPNGLFLTALTLSCAVSVIGCSKDSSSSNNTDANPLAVEAPKLPEPVELISRYTGGDYTTATYSFRHLTRDNVDLTRHNWEILFEAREDFEDFFTVTMVVDDNSFIYDLGNKSCASLKSDYPEARKTRPLTWLAYSEARPSGKTAQSHAKVQLGHCYLTFNNDSEGRVIALFRVVAHEKSKRVKIDEIEVLEVLTR